MRREVFYIAGYDPRTYRFYYNLFKKNLKDYCFDFDLKVQLGALEKNGYCPFFTINSHNVSIKYHFLTWNDIVKKHWSQTYKDALLDCYNIFKIYTISGLFIKIAKESTYQLITGFYPFFYLLFCLLAPLFLTLVSFFCINVHFILALSIGCFLGFLLHHFLFKLGRKLAVFWIARICTFCATWQEKKSGIMEQRMRLFADQILQSLRQNQGQDDYELLLIAHSVGTILSIEVLTYILEANLDKTLLDKLKILTLGQCIPLTSYQKREDEFRKKLQFLSQFDLKWYDYTSIIDGACFPQVDFFRTSGIKAKFTPAFLSAKFHTLYEKNAYKKIKRNKNKTHFLYLYSVKIRGAYDFFSFVIAPQFLEQKVRL